MTPLTASMAKWLGNLASGREGFTGFPNGAPNGTVAGLFARGLVDECGRITGAGITYATTAMLIESRPQRPTGEPLQIDTVLYHQLDHVARLAFKMSQAVEMSSRRATDDLKAKRAAEAANLLAGANWLKNFMDRNAIPGVVRTGKLHGKRDGTGVHTADREDESVHAVHGQRPGTGSPEKLRQGNEPGI